MVEENVLYYTDEFVKGKFIEEKALTFPHKGQIEIDGAELVRILEDHVSEWHHRCVVVYRDAFVHNGDTYNICLSCGDYYKNDEHYYLDREGRNKIRAIKNGR